MGDHQPERKSLTEVNFDDDTMTVLHSHAVDRQTIELAAALIHVNTDLRFIEMQNINGERILAYRGEFPTRAEVHAGKTNAQPSLKPDQQEKTAMSKERESLVDAALSLDDELTPAVKTSARNKGTSPDEMPADATEVPSHRNRAADRPVKPSVKE